MSHYAALRAHDWLRILIEAYREKMRVLSKPGKALLGSNGRRSLVWPVTAEHCRYSYKCIMADLEGLNFANEDAELDVRQNACCICKLFIHGSLGIHDIADKLHQCRQRW